MGRAGHFSGIVASYIETLSHNACKITSFFSFDVRDDIRLVNDATIEKEESHAGKVVLRNWYERNKHIFPASRWEPYDPTKTYEKYTYHDKKPAKLA